MSVIKKKNFKASVDETACLTWGYKEMVTDSFTSSTCNQFAPDRDSKY